MTEAPNLHVFIGLMHYPVYNKQGETITTSITNLDLHDIARSAATFGIDKYYIIHPGESQRRIAQEIIFYWREGYGSRYNPDRQYAFNLFAMAATLEEAVCHIRESYGQQPQIVVTDARVYPRTTGYNALREIMENRGGCYLILFGTGWGIHRDVMMQADYILEPIYGRNGYNHLSVRSAAAIILDRLFGAKWW